ncbi:hypothetical protein Clacol_002483 [Clathrus columnatus]|uniref:Uracil-DNA glycosylase-like domain-containing protein n=1 Tax=Clathrus columnatus TaxID=1419009 RepID=A0AAV5A511_9AGAM|nr:hypothetical protein Clacol_002483 [Clathrus columnatus]
MSVYLDDLPTPSSENTTTGTANNIVEKVGHEDKKGTPQASSNDDAKNSKSLKRQLSIADMFAKTPRNNTKRQKTEDESSSMMRRAVSLGGLPSLNSIPLNLDAFTASLTPEECSLLKLEMETMNKSWLKVLTDEIKKPYFLSLKKWLASEGLEGAKSASTIYPPGKCRRLCFSVPKGVQPPPSLKNIYAELKTEYPEFEPPNHGWASNGVLLLNTCLTVRAGKAGSHSNKGWEQFTDRVVDVIDRYGGANLGRGDGECTGNQRLGVSRGVVFLAWGSWAQKRVARLDKHPSPLSAFRGFFGNNHFREANSWLEAKYGSDGKVDWCKLD